MSERVRGKWIVLPAALAALMGGCVKNRPGGSATTQPVTAVDAAVAEPRYWLNQPATAEVRSREFAKLWDASEATARSYLFAIDLRDYRQGLLKTQPMVSKQWFELWRKDAGTARDVGENSLGSIRRTIHFQFTKNLDGSFTVTPKVLVERESIVDPKYAGQVQKPGIYWYALRRDTAMERKLATDIERRLEP